MATTTMTGRMAGAASVFDAVAAAFTVLSDGHDPVGLNCRPYLEHGLPAGFLTLRQLRDWMLAHPRAYAARDVIWRDFLVRARAEPAWMTAVIGMALPGLVRAAGRLARGYRGDAGDIDAEMVASFVAAVHTVDLDTPYVYDRLRRQAIRDGLAVRNADMPDHLVGDIESVSGAAPKLPYGHPDLIVARAVAAEIIDRHDADLIVATRLDCVPVETVAARVGIDAATLRMRRVRAERALADAVRGGLLSGAISADSRERISRRAAARTAVRAAFAA